MPIGPVLVASVASRGIGAAALDFARTVGTMFEAQAARVFDRAAAANAAQKCGRSDSSIIAIASNVDNTHLSAEGEIGASGQGALTVSTVLRAQPPADCRRIAIFNRALFFQLAAGR